MKKNIFVMFFATIFTICLGLGFEEAGKIDTPVNLKTGQYDSLDNSGVGWGLKKVKNSEPEVTKKQKDMLLEYNSFYMGDSSQKKLYLTFDEGYENGHTAEILDILKEKGVPAAFFITGPYAKKENELVRRMIDEGHIVGNHTVNHPNLPKLQTAEKMEDELSQMRELVLELYGYEMKYMRPPEGEYSRRLLAVSRDMGFRTVFWSFAYKDWDVKAQKGKEYAFNQVSEYLHNGAVLLLHAVSEDNKKALPDIIDYARSQGYEFMSLDDIK